MSYPLIDRYPGLASLPRVALCDVPTPIEPVDLGIDVGALAVKRDDLTSSVYGGNKVRKLEFLLGDALERGCRSVITFGAYGSNHALATAVHARALGLEPHVVLSPQEPGPFAARTLLAHAGLGTGVHPIDGWDGRRRAVEVRRELAERDGVEPCVIPMGGTSALGAVGYVNAALELLGQAADGGGEPDAVYVAGGTLGTAVGLAIGFAVAGAATRTVALRVTPSEVANRAFAERLIGETVELLRSHDVGFPALAHANVRFELRDDWFAPGYGVVTPESSAAVEAAHAAGVHLETTYTGKAFAALLADARAGGLLHGQRVVFIDTYNSAPYPPAGPAQALPRVLRDYVERCETLYGKVADAGVEEGDRE